MPVDISKDNISQVSNIYSFFISLYYFLLIIFPQYDMYLISITIITNICYIILHLRKPIHSNFFLNCYFIFVSWLVIGFLYTGVVTYEHIRFLLFVVATLGIIINLGYLENWEKFLFKNMIMFNLILVGSGFLQIAFPSLLNIINSIHLKSDHYHSALYFQGMQIIVGFTQNPAIIAFAISIVLFYLFIKIIYEGNNTKKIIYLLLFIFSYYLLFSTGKRVFLIISIVGLVYLIIRLFGSNFESKVKAVLILGMIASVFVIFLFKTEIGQMLLLRTIDTEDVSTGRFDIYNILWKDFLNSPIIGNGTYSTKQQIYINNGHNIYIQILRENGIIGFILFAVTLMGNFILTDSLFKKTKSINTSILLAMSSSIQLLFILWGFTGNPLYDNYPLVAYVMFSSIPWKIRNYSS